MSPAARIICHAVLMAACRVAHGSSAGQNNCALYEYVCVCVCVRPTSYAHNRFAVQAELPLIYTIVSHALYQM